MNIGGVYKIINKVNNKYYVGSTSNFKKRWNQHIKLLNRNKHKNDYLQNVWNKYGEKSFEFIVVEYTDVNLVKIIEQKYLDIAEKEQDKSYNLNFNSLGGCLSEYSKEKIKQNKIKYWQDFEKRKSLGVKLKNKIALNTEYRKTMSDRTKLFFKDSKNRKRLSETMKTFHSLPETKRRWSELNSGLKNPLSDKTVYRFFNKKTGNREFCTRYELRTNPKYFSENLSQSGVAQLCLGKFPSYKGWIIDTLQS
jgi:group I intron endonuclease